LTSQRNTEAAKARAIRNRRFWTAVFDGPGLTYTELSGMDLAEFEEAMAAKTLYFGTWLEEAKANQKGGG